MAALPSVGAVLLSMGNRPEELAAALATLLTQTGVELDVLVVGNGWEPTGLPAGVRTLHLPENAPAWLATHPKLTAKQKSGMDAEFRKRAQSVVSVDRMGPIPERPAHSA